MMIFSRHCGVTPSPDIRSPYTNSGILDPATGCRSFHISSISWHYGGFDTKVVFWMILGYPHFRKRPYIHLYEYRIIYIYIQYSVYIYIHVYVRQALPITSIRRISPGSLTRLVGLHHADGKCDLRVRAGDEPVKS